ncbi:hypothetical protein HGRIS_000193 [Hohenbuehelia grisea]|uniref:F-box domain-containing protein n=1 Tax=Hohenbuehelia grisea TaxID=104357 RepID=A0ABR3JS91_9AGAR
MHSVDTPDVVERRSDVVVAEAKYKQLNSELQELDLKRKDIREHLDTLKVGIEGHKIALAAHIHSRIPAEVFSEIFQYCCVTDALDVFNREGPQQHQWILSAVCRRWRTIALSTPQLWSSLHFDVAYAIRNHFRDIAGIAREILQRSGRVRLAVTLDMHAHRHRLISVLLKESSRWRSFRLILRLHKSSHKMVAMLNDQGGNFPVLEALAVEITGDLPAPLTAFETCPKLRTVVLSGESLVRNVAVPWGQITRFSGLQLRIVDNPHRLLQNMPAVQHAVINLSDYRSSIDTPKEPTLFSDMLSLHLSGPCLFIQYTILPALTELSMESCDLLEEHYTSLFSQVGGSLTTLELGNLKTALGIRLSTFQHLARLERLEIFSRFDIDSTIYNGMAATGTGAVIFPNLCILHLGFRISITAPLLRMLYSRIMFRHVNARSPASLDRVFIGYKAVTDDLHDRMSALHGNGTHIEFVKDGDPIIKHPGEFEALRCRLSTRYGSSAFYRS